MNFLKIKNFLLVFLIIFSYLISVVKTYAVDITADRTISSSSDGDQYNIKTNNDIDVIVTNNSTLERNQKIFNVSAASLTGSSITIHVGSSVIAETNSIFSNGAELTITNTGTIEATNSKAINVSNSDGVSITNNKNGVIKSNNNTILGDAGAGADNVTIDNSGEIFTTATGTESSAIVFANNDTGNTITNNSGGEIYSSGSESTIVLGVSSTLTNSGSIKNNKSVTNKAIQLKGDNNTVTLKDAGIVVGKIRSGNGTTGNKLRFNHGVGRAYYYDISGNFDLEDLDGNQVVIGSAGSVGQGGSETIDEMLSYKSINLRNFLNRYENSNLFNHKGGWGELYSSLLNRSEDSNSLAMEYNLINIGANLIYPLENSDFIMMFESGVQDFEKDYKITYQNISGGINIPENDKFFNLDTFVTSGITLKDGKRTVLTNTETSGTIDSNSNFQTYDIQIGAKKNNFKIIPDIGFTSSISVTPTYDESKFYSWRNRVVGNLSIYLSDNYLIRDDKKEKLNLNWALDLRSAIGDDEQTYSINGTTATYKQDNDLKREISLSANMNYEKYIYENSMIGFAYYGLLSSQNTLSLGGNAFYKMNF
ncbi:hypothetical protein [Candidatus Pelagibacter sp.]|uniref:hypothetical protein n=1 Tax=Candidatus Pelagibacter sp. TaxID=2024849 RepID=UPI003F850698